MPLRERALGPRSPRLAELTGGPARCCPGPGGSPRCLLLPGQVPRGPLVAQGRGRGVAGVLPGVGNQGHAGLHLQFLQGVQIDQARQLRGVSESAADPVHGVAEDPLVVQSLGRVHVTERGDVPALELFEGDDGKCVTCARRGRVRVTPCGD
jgi:hypothetical protein